MGITFTWSQILKPELESISCQVTHAVEYSGNGGGRYPLTWSQKWLWRSVVNNFPKIEYMNLSSFIPVVEDCKIETALQAISILLNRHHALRTRFNVDESGNPYQFVVDHGYLNVIEYEVEDGSQNGAVHGVLTDMSEHAFVSPEISLRAALITCNGNLEFIAICVFHMAADRWSLRNLTGDLKILLASAPNQSERSLSPPLPPLSVRTIYEQSPSGRRCSMDSVAFWDKRISFFPRAASPIPEIVPDSPIYRDIVMRSMALSTVAYSLAEKIRVGVPAVLTAATASLLCKVLGTPEVGILQLCHNRFQAGTDFVSGPLIQDFPILVHPGAKSFPETCKDIHTQCMLGSLHSQYDPEDLATTMNSIRERQGFYPDLSYAINITAEKLYPELQPLDRPTAAELRQLSAATMIEDGAGVDRENMAPGLCSRSASANFYLVAHLERQNAKLALQINTRMFSLSDGRRYLADLEEFMMFMFLSQSE